MKNKISNTTKLKLVYFFKSLFFFSPILTLFYFSRNLNTFQVVSLEAILIGAVLISEVPTGILADKIGRKYSLLMVILLYIAGNIWTIYAYSYLEFFIIEILFGIAIAFGSGAIEALVYDSLKVQHKEKQMSKVWGSINSYGLIASMIAVIIGGFIAKDHNPENFVLLLWLYTIGAIIAFFVALFVTERRHEKVIEREKPLELFNGSTIQILKNKSLRRIIYLYIFTSPFDHIIIFLFQPYFIIANVENSLWGIAMAIGMLLGAVLMRNSHNIEKQFGMKKTIFISTLLPGLIYVAMAFIIGPAISLIWFVLLRGISNIREPLFSQYKNNHIKSHNRATVLSVISMITSLYLLVIRLIIGSIANQNLILSFVIMGAIISLGAIFFRIYERHVRVEIRD